LLFWWKFHQKWPLKNSKFSFHFMKLSRRNFQLTSLVTRH